MEDQSPILDTLDSKMRCGMFSNSKGDIMIVHCEPLASDIQWIEFDKAARSMSLIHEDGKIQDLGIDLNDQAIKNISHGQEVTLVHFENKVITSHQTTVMIIQEE